jgi:hypothetical protein
MKRRLVRCGGIAATPADGEEALDLSLWGKSPNINVKLEDLSGPMVANLPPILADLIELATYVYIADQAVTRGGHTTGAHGELWRRRFRFVVPVRDLDTWNRQSVGEALTDLLTFLSEDEFSFEFVELTGGPSLQEYLDFGTTNPLKMTADEVLLFSGGLDSLAGACETVLAHDRRPILVTHRSASKLYPRQDRLIAALRARASQDRLVHVPVRIRKASKLLDREYSQRTRSFLYACLAAVVAHMAGVPRVRFFENGVVSLNLPIGPQLVGSRNTRTTHPQVIRGFGRFLEAVLGSPLPLDNGYLWKTKADVVRVIAENGCSDLVAESVSCTRVFSLSNYQTHCGRCSQCLDRRFAVLAAGLEQHDPGHRYATHINGLDLLTCPRDAGETRAMAELYYKRAHELADVTDRDFFSRYAGEVARAIGHIDGLPDDNARRILDLHRRHGREVIGVVGHGVVSHADLVLSGGLDESSLLRMAMPRARLEAQAQAAPTTAKADPNRALLMKVDDGVVELDGVPVVRKARAPMQWVVLRYFVDRWAEAVKSDGEKRRWHRLSTIHDDLQKSGLIDSADEESTRQLIQRVKHACCEKHWKARVDDPNRASIDHDTVIQTSPDGKGYRLNPGRVAVATGCPDN